MRVENIGDATLYLGDCMEILPTLPKVDACITDPPYGTSELWDKSPRKANKWQLFCTGSIKDWDKPQELAWLAKFEQAIIWGGNYYALPPSRAWLVWNKIIRNFTTSVCELAWTNLNHPIDAFDYSHGQLATEGKQHPTQKPLPLMTWCVEKTIGTVLDPFMGSGTTGVACAQLGRKFIGIEIEPKYFDIACRRIEDAYRQKPLFEPEPVKAEQGALL